MHADPDHRAARAGGLFRLAARLCLHRDLPGAGGGLTFYLGAWLERGQADLQAFFDWHPWLYLFLVPAVGMRLWAEERKTGTIEFLMTQPVTTLQAVLGKFLAAWLFVGIALALTFPIWLTVNYLGEPDNGVILAGYLGSWLMAGGLLAISAAVSALTKQPGDRLRAGRRDLLSVPDERPRAGAGVLPRLGAGRADRRPSPASAC